jgi:ribosome biogenesis GTPase
VSAALTALGWNAALARHFELHALQGLVPARVAVEHRNQYELLAERGPVTAALAGKLRHAGAVRLERPAVGDWVAIIPPPADGVGTIQAVLPRLSVFTRKMSGREQHEQIVAANIDIAFLVTSLNAELNLRRTERYLTLAWESGAKPIIVLSKADRCEDPAPIVSEMERVAAGVPVIVTSAKTEQGIAALAEALAGHRTGALLGSSGVGKSTLINALLGWERLATREIREDDARGRHTTTRRELVLLPAGGVLIDTPGMRELALSEAGHGLLSAFDDVEALAEACTFRDCRHGPEPGCAVRRAIAEGRLAAERLESYHKLTRELELRTSWEDKRLAAEQHRRERVIGRAQQKFLKERGR